MGGVINTDERGVRWRRLGECSRCGECCSPDPGVGYFTAAERASATCEGFCPLYRHDGERASCAGHGTHQFYLGGCVDHPKLPGDLATTPSCSYSFVRVG